MLILTEAGKKIGFGHFTRCSAIAERLAKSGEDIDLAVDWRGEAKNSSSFIPFSWESIEEFLDSVQKYDCCLVDSYLATKDHFKQLSSRFESVIVIDDYGRFYSFGAELVINPNIYGNDIEYGDQSIGGPDFIILREEFKKGIKDHRTDHEITNIGFFVGGNDYRMLLPKLIDSFSNIDAHLHILCGEEAYREEIDRTYNEYTNITSYGYLEASQVAGVLNQVDVMISGGGQSLHELAYAGIPTIVICIDKDQELNINAYVNAGFLKRKISWDDSDLHKKILFHLDELIPVNMRKGISEIGKKLIDGKGTSRIVNVIKDVQQAGVQS